MSGMKASSLVFSFAIFVYFAKRVHAAQGKDSAFVDHSGHMLLRRAETAPHIHEVDATLAVPVEGTEMVVPYSLVSISGDDEAVKFFELVAEKIKGSWFLTGDPVALVVGSSPFLVSPSDKTHPVKGPDLVKEELGGNIETDVAALAKQFKDKGVTPLFLWSSDLDTLKKLALNCDDHNMMALSDQGKLRGFLDGVERSHANAKDIPKSELLKLAISTLWIRGGLGRDGILKQAIETSGTTASSSLVQKRVPGDVDWFHSMLRALPSDSSHEDLASKTRAVLSAYVNQTS